MKKLNLKKKVVSVLTDEEKQFINGGEGTTSYSECTKFICCEYKGCKDASLGVGNTCLTTPNCEGTIAITSYC